MRSPVRLLAVLTVLTSSCLAETETITFYSVPFPVKDQLKVAVTFKGTMAFTGWIFDGNQALAHAKADRFVSFHLTPGPHTLSVSYNQKHPGKTQSIQLTVEAGHNYCVRLSQKYENPIVVPVGFIQGSIEAVDCRQALQDAGDIKPLEIKRVEKSAQGMLDTSNKFPSTD